MDQNDWKPLDEIRACEQEVVSNGQANKQTLRAGGKQTQPQSTLSSNILF